MILIFHRTITVGLGQIVYLSDKEFECYVTLYEASFLIVSLIIKQTCKTNF